MPLTLLTLHTGSVILLICFLSCASTSLLRRVSPLDWQYLHRRPLLHRRRHPWIGLITVHPFTNWMRPIIPLGRDTRLNTWILMRWPSGWWSGGYRQLRTRTSALIHVILVIGITLVATVFLIFPTPHSVRTFGRGSQCKFLHSSRLSIKFARFRFCRAIISSIGGNWKGSGCFSSPFADLVAECSNLYSTGHWDMYFDDICGTLLYYTQKWIVLKTQAHLCSSALSLEMPSAFVNLLSFCVQLFASSRLCERLSTIAIASELPANSRYYIPILHPDTTSWYYIPILHPDTTSRYYIPILHPDTTSRSTMLIIIVATT